VALEDVCVHRATRYELRESGAYVEGSVDLAPVAVQSFACVLFLPQGDEESGGSRGGRQVRRPTLLALPFDEDGAETVIPAKARLGVVAPELNVTEGRDADAELLWQVSGSAQPFGPPGETVVGLQATLVRVED
jgi:hypothetical protein